MLIINREMEFTVRLLTVICARKETVNGAYRSPYIRSSVLHETEITVRLIRSSVFKDN